MWRIIPYDNLITVSYSKSTNYQKLRIIEAIWQKCKITKNVLLEVSSENLLINFLFVVINF